MNISKSFETEQGTVKFEGEIEGAELDYVLKMGLLTVMRQGLVNTVMAVPADDEDTLH